MFNDKTIIDLTLELENGIQTWYIHPKVILEDYHVIGKDRCHTKLMTFTDHTGTHVDAQTHFYPAKGKSISDYDPEKFIGSAVYLDVSFRDIDQPITAKDLEKALINSGENIIENDIIVLKAWPFDREHEKFEKSPGLTREAANWCMDKKIKLFATDLATVDHQDKDLYTHKNFLENDILIIENLVNLEQIKQSRFYFIGLPLRIKGATGSPVRAIAIIDLD